MDKVIAKMEPGKWYNIKPEQVNEFKKTNIENIELTFNKNFTKVKKTLWKDGKPIFDKKRSIKIKKNDTDLRALLGMGRLDKWNV